MTWIPKQIIDLIKFRNEPLLICIKDQEFKRFFVLINTKGGQIYAAVVLGVCGFFAFFKKSINLMNEGRLLVAKTFFDDHHVVDGNHSMAKSPGLSSFVGMR